MKIKKFEEFNSLIFREFNNDNNYEVIGCFKEPSIYTVVGTEDFFDSDDSSGNFNTNMDFEIFISNENEVKKVYDYIKIFIKNNNNIEDCVVYGIFLNGDKSCLVSSDYDYCYEMYLLGAVLDNLKIDRNDTNYIRDAHANKEAIEEEYPDIFAKIKDYFNDIW